MIASPGGPEFHGSVSGLAKQMIAAVLPISAAVSFLLFGSLGGRIFLVSLILVPVLTLFAWLLARVDRIRFDDAEGLIRRNLRPPLPYGRIERVRFVDSLGVLQSIAHVGRRTELLTIGLDEDAGEDLQRAIRQRVKGVEFDSRTYGAWKLTAIAVGVLAASAIAGSFYLERKAGAPAAACAAAPAPGAPSQAGEPIVRAGQGIVVTVPRELEVTKFTVARLDKFEETGRSGKVFLKVAGLRSEFALFHYAACSRYGVVPRMLKAALLGRWETPRVFTHQHESFRTLLVAGRRNETTEARVLLYDEATETEAMVAVLLSKEFDVTTLASLLPQFKIAPALEPSFFLPPGNYSEPSFVFSYSPIRERFYVL